MQQNSIKSPNQDRDSLWWTSNIRLAPDEVENDLSAFPTSPHTRSDKHLNTVQYYGPHYTSEKRLRGLAPQCTNKNNRCGIRYNTEWTCTT